jgi:hypothetical protein
MMVAATAGVGLRRDWMGYGGFFVAVVGMLALMHFR